MKKKIIFSLSVLKYETDLKKHIQDIGKLLSNGMDWLHVDIMRDPFIAGKNTFFEESLSVLYNEFADLADFDFHLMVVNPDLIIRVIDRIIPDSNKKKSMITIHREAYRNNLGNSNNLNQYYTKDCDLCNIVTGDSSLDRRLRAVNEGSGELVYKTLQTIKEKGFKTGLALDPNTSLDNLSRKMSGILDMILLMGVSSGAGGQKYKSKVSDKIKEAKKNYKRLMIQVDGGINNKTLPEIIKAGADNVVIGSYLTAVENPVQQLEYIKTLIPSFS